MNLRTSLLLALFINIIGSMVYASFEPNDLQKEELNQIKNQLIQLTQEGPIVHWNLYEQARDLQQYFNEEKTNYYLEHLRDFLYSSYIGKKELQKRESKEYKKDFLENHKDLGLENAENLPTNCIGRYNTIDNISYAYDFPTALTIAIRYRESNCGYYLPKNKNGPFQIIKKDYGNGEINRKIFETTIHDFLLFAKNKIKWHNEKNPEEENQIKLNYQKANYQDIYKFAALYNGLSGATIYGEISPSAPKYFFEKMPGEFEEGKRNGLFLHYLKTIERELEQE